MGMKGVRDNVGGLGWERPDSHHIFYVNFAKQHCIIWFDYRPIPLWFVLVCKRHKQRFLTL